MTMNCTKCDMQLDYYIVVHKDTVKTPEYWCLRCVWRQGSDDATNEAKEDDGVYVFGYRSEYI
jgi:hypothetical protein